MIVKQPISRESNAIKIPGTLALDSNFTKSNLQFLVFFVRWFMLSIFLKTRYEKLIVWIKGECYSTVTIERNSKHNLWSPANRKKWRREDMHSHLCWDLNLVPPEWQKLLFYSIPVFPIYRILYSTSIGSILNLEKLGYRGRSLMLFSNRQTEHLKSKKK